MDPLSPVALALAFALPVHPTQGTIDYLDGDGTYPGRLALVAGASPADDVVWIAHRNLDAPTRLSRLALAPGVTPERLAELAPPAAGPARGAEPRPNALAVDPAGAWLATDAGLFRWDAAQRTLVRRGSEAAVSHLVATPDGLLFAVAEIPGVGASAAPVDGFGGARDPLAGRATVPRADAAAAVGPARIWVGGHGGIIEAAPRGAFRLDLAGTPLAAIPPDRFDVRALAVAGHATWIAAGTQLFRATGDHYEPIGRHVSSLVPDGADALIVGSWAPEAVERMLEDRPPERLWPLAENAGAQLRVLAAGPEGIWIEEEPPAGAPHRVVRVARSGGALTLWPLARAGRTYLSPGIVDALRDGRGGLLIATNDGLWHLR